MSVITGVLDARNRPLLKLQVNGRPITCLVDTGFTGGLAIGVDQAEILRIHQEKQIFRSETAGTRASFRMGEADISWCGHVKKIGVCVWQKPRVGPVDGIIGCYLLIGCILTVDFNEGFVRLEDLAIAALG